MATIYPKGISVFPPNDKAPDYVKAKVTIHKSSMSESFQKEYQEYITEKGYLNMNVKKGDKGLYIDVDTWKPKPKTTEPTELTSEEMKFHSPLGEDYPTDDDAQIPF